MSRRVVAVMSAVLMISATGTGLVMASPEGTGRGGGGGTTTLGDGSPLGGERHTVTLLTGDRVTVTSQTGPDGSPVTAAVVQQADRPHGGTVAFTQFSTGEHLFVLPSDVAPLVSRGVLDRRLFDVTGLVEAGLTDNETTRLIVQLADAPGRTLGATARGLEHSSALDVDRTLTSIDAVATEVTPEQGLELLAGLAAATPGTNSATARTAATGTVERIWLDAPVRTTDAESMPQIGADHAWEAGYTGAGVTVAVLDTGIDSTHPDLVGKVVLEGNFSESPDTNDRTGHGTHVAGTIAGTGALDPAMRGVAYESELVNTKVLDDDGNGWESDVIAGMEWSAQQGADILNMSLGVPFGFTDGTDPGALAVNEVSEEYGVLVVVAAGNEGWAGPGSVATPGSADLGLTVGAVDKSDLWADFSGQGPRAGDGALKPDIVAPGVDIVSARAAEGFLGDPVGDHYASMSGTSMATPHVSGAAALLLESEPDLTGPDLKSVLMGSAQDVGDTVWRVGAGRVFLPTALDAPVVAHPASLSYGIFTYPQDDLDPVTKSLSYRNDGDEEVSLTFDTEVTGEDGSDASAAVALSAVAMSIAPGGTATISVTVTPGAVDVGLFGGVVLATDDEGRTVRTPIGFDNEPLKHALTIRAIGRDGLPALTDVAVLNVDDATVFGEISIPVDGETTIRVEPGSYSVTSYIPAWDESGEWPEVVSLSAIYEPQVEVDGDMVVELDAREANPITVRTPRAAETVGADMSHLREDAAGNGSFIVGWGAGGDTALYATPTEPVVDGLFEHFVGYRMTGPGSRPDYTYDLVFPEQVVPANLAYRVRNQDLARIETTYRGYSDPSIFVEGRMPLLPGWWFASGSLWDQAGPVARTEFVTAGDVQWSQSVMEPTADGWPLTWWDSAFESYAGGAKASNSWLSAVYSPGVAGVSGIRLGDLVEMSLPHVVDDQGHATFVEGASSQLALWADGSLVAETADGYLFADVPPVADLRVVQETLVDDPMWPRSTQLRSEWMFPSATTEDLESLPMLDIRYGVQRLGLLNDTGRQVKLDASVHLMQAVDGSASAPQVRGFQAWWSADDGETWHPARVVRQGHGGIMVNFQAPKGTAHISLKARAWDASGSEVTEEVIRAFAIH